MTLTSTSGNASSVSRVEGRWDVYPPTDCGLATLREELHPEVRRDLEHRITKTKAFRAFRHHQAVGHRAIGRDLTLHHGVAGDTFRIGLRGIVPRELGRARHLHPTGVRD